MSIVELESLINSEHSEPLEEQRQIFEVAASIH